MFDIHQPLSDEDGPDEAEFEQYVDGLMAEFARSPEAQPVLAVEEDLGWSAMMLGYAYRYIGCTPPKMTLRDFNEVLFGLFPRKVSVEADEAGAIVTELRAFWEFVARQYELDNARVILASLTDTTTTKLQKRLSDPANFGMAKSFFMMGKQAGYDMTTPEGLAAYQAVYNAQLSTRLAAPQLPAPPHPPAPSRAEASPPLLPPARQTGEDLKKKRKEKKRQRDAKKRNRRG